MRLRRRTVVRRLTGTDSGFLALETPVQPMHSVALFLLGPGDAVDLDALRRHVADRLPLLPALRWRLRHVPLGLAHPVYTDAADVDLVRHVREQRVPAPGGDAELDRLHAALAEQPLDLTGPLWNLVLVRGLAGGREAVVVRVHHCLMDGRALLALHDVLLSELPSSVVESWRPGREPRPAALLVRGAGAAARGVARVPRLVVRT
ncbi:MAG: Diacylglycerol O-acyltransferase, partial [Frankiales bacterium]|nr:Diacylglycerol O-acyltransferase [Frankiales bacterium]